MMDTMQSGLDFVVVDTRDRGSYVYSHIERACNIEYNLFGDPMVRQEMLASLNPQKPIILYCA
jgi:predicted sulfurtransferase